MLSKRKREPFDYREHYPLPTSPRKRRKSVASFDRCSAQQQQIYKDNSVASPLLRLPPEIRNEIYGHVLSNQVIHISVRECPRDDTCSWSHAEYNRATSGRAGPKNLELDRKLKFTHSLCTLPYDEEDHAHERATQRNRTTPTNPSPKYERTSYRIRHKPCYHALARLKGNWIREGENVTVSPLFEPASRPGLSVAFLQTCRQIYSESRGLVYTSNTFAFHEGNTLDLFLSQCVTRPQLRLISSLQLDGWNALDYEPGHKVRPGVLQKLTGLKSLRVAVIWLGTRCNYQYIGGPSVQNSGGQSDVVKVTVDQHGSELDEADYGNVLKMERSVVVNVEAALGMRAPLPT